MKTLVVLPSYNEKENIGNLISAILAESSEYSVCVVDDNSPDMTKDIVEKYKLLLPHENQNRLNLIVRKKKDGRGGAVREGIKWGLQSDFDSFVEMDCDFSHPPTDLKRGIELLKNNDVVMGSRYPNGKVIGWPFKRKALSFCANLLARSLISWDIGDYTNGFRFYNRKSAEYLCAKDQKHKGYIYLSESIACLINGGFKIASFPIIFVNRERGVSNTTFSEVSQSLTAIFSIAWNHRFGAK